MKHLWIEGAVITDQKKKSSYQKKKKRIERAEEFDPKNKAEEKETGLGINHLKAR